MNTCIAPAGLTTLLLSGFLLQNTVAVGQALGPLPDRNARQDSATPATPKAPSDVLTFTNGDKLTGKLERAAGGDVIFKSDMAGELTIPISKVKELRSGSEFVALRKGRPGEYPASAAGTVAFSGDEVEIKPANAPEQVLPTSSLAYLVDVPTYAKAVDQHAGFLEGWSVAATGGLTLVRSTQKSTTFTAAAKLMRVIPIVSYLPSRNRTTVNIAETFGSEVAPVIPQTVPPTEPAVTKTSIFHGDGARDRYISSRFFVLGDLSYDHNFSQGLQLQQVYGLGIGWTPVKTAFQELDIRADTHYEKQQFLPASASAPTINGVVVNNFNLIGSTFQENYRRDLPFKFLLTQWANILPAWNDRQAYTANAYFSLDMPLLKRLTATVSATDNYLNNPSPGYKANSVQLVTGLTYTVK